MNQFDFLAPFYDQLVEAVFDQRIKHCTHSFLRLVRDKDRVLIIGGGTGRSIGNTPGNITYIEKSKKMVDRARRYLKYSKVNFLIEDFFHFKAPQKYDKIVCPFFLDCFNPKNLRTVLLKIHSLLSDEGMLIVSDFERSEQLNNRILHVIMYVFFRFTANLDSKYLCDIHQVVIDNGFEEMDRKNFGKTIYSSTYKKKLDSK